MPVPVFATYQPFHSTYQIKHFIIQRSGITLYGAYKQVMREIWSRLHGLYAILEDLPPDRTPILQERHNTSVSHQTSSVGVRQIGFGEFEQYVAVKDTCRELILFLAYASIIRARLGELSGTRIEELEAEYWTFRTKLAVARDLIQAGHLGSETIELIHSLPTVDRGEIVTSLATRDGVGRLIAWYWTYELELGTPDPLLRLIQRMPVGRQVRCLLGIWTMVDGLNQDIQLVDLNAVLEAFSLEASQQSHHSKSSGIKKTWIDKTGERP